MAISAEEFRQASRRLRKTDDAEIEGYGVIRLQSLSAGDVIRFRRELTNAGDNANELMFWLVARSWIADDGGLLFPESEGEAEARLMGETAFGALIKKVYLLNGLTAEAVEDAGKN
jgi:hypothetical protein